jgi:hypothetical protein
LVRTVLPALTPLWSRRRLLADKPRIGAPSSVNADQAIADRLGSRRCHAQAGGEAVRDSLALRFYDRLRPNSNVGPRIAAAGFARDPAQPRTQLCRPPMLAA